VSAAIEFSALTKSFGTAMSWSSRRYGAEASTVTPQSHRFGGAVHDEIGLWWQGSRRPSDPLSHLVFAGHCKEGLGRVTQAEVRGTRPAPRSDLQSERLSGIGQPRAAVVGEVLNGLCAPARQPAGALTRGPGTAPRTRRVLACRIALLAAMTGDVNPVHVGAKPAGRSTFGWDCGLFDAFCCPASARSRRRVAAAGRFPAVDRPLRSGGVLPADDFAIILRRNPTADPEDRPVGRGGHHLSTPRVR